MENPGQKEPRKKISWHLEEIPVGCFEMKLMGMLIEPWNPCSNEMIPA